MRELVIVDMQYMYYRHLYRLRKYEECHGGAPMLSYDGAETGRLYFTMKDFMSIVSLAQDANADLVVCMDSKSARKEENEEYKSNRGGLVDIDGIALANIKNCLVNGKFAIMKKEGLEADDLIAAIVRNRGDEYDRVHIFTPDSDLCALVNDKVCIWRYKSTNSIGGGKHVQFIDAHDRITKDTFEAMLSAELKTEVPFNSIILYKCLVGDTSDKIAGVKGFGKAAFGKFVQTLKRDGVDFTTLNDPEEVAKLVVKYENVFGESGAAQAIASLQLVRSWTDDEVESVAKSIDMTRPDLSIIRSEFVKFGIVSL